MRAEREKFLDHLVIKGILEHFCPDFLQMDHEERTHFLIGLYLTGFKDENFDFILSHEDLEELAKINADNLQSFIKEAWETFAEKPPSTLQMPHPREGLS